MFERLTARSPKNNMAYLINVKQNEQDVESPYPNTLRCIMDSFNRLAAYEDSGLSPEQIEAQQQEIDRLQRWVNDLQSGMYVNCVYCGHRYGMENDTPVAMADVFKEHIEHCPKHPMSKLKQEIERLEYTLKKARDLIENANSNGILEHVARNCMFIKKIGDLLGGKDDEN